MNFPEIVFSVLILVIYDKVVRAGEKCFKKFHPGIYWFLSCFQRVYTLCF